MRHNPAEGSCARMSWDQAATQPGAWALGGQQVLEKSTFLGQSLQQGSAASKPTRSPVCILTHISVAGYVLENARNHKLIQTEKPCCLNITHLLK